MQSNQPNATPPQTSVQYQSSQSFMTQHQPTSGFTLIDRVKKSLDLTTPQILRRSMFGLWGLSLIWVPVTINAIQAQRNSVKTIAEDSIPSVLLALRLTGAMSDMDASAANALLDPKQKDIVLIQEPGAKLAQNPQAKKTGVEPALKKITPEQEYFNKRRNDLAERLTKAAKNITVPEEEKIIQNITLVFGDYLAYVERAQAANRNGDQATALAQYQLAAQLLDDTLTPQGYELSKINHEVLEKKYRESKWSNRRSIAYVVVLGLATIVGLAMLQRLLTVRTQRVLNPMLLGATATAILFLLTSVSLLLSSSEKLRVIKEDSYNSLVALRTGRTLMYAANSAESRYLLDKPNRQIHEDVFFAKTKQAFGRSDSQAFLTSSIQAIEQKQRNSAITGEFATAINNITFSEERDNLVEMMKQLKIYMQLDQEMRDLVARNDEKAALALCLGASNDAFNKFRESLTKTIDVNVKVFEDTSKKTKQQLDHFELKATIALALMAGLIFFGLQPRLKEYS